MRVYDALAMRGIHAGEALRAGLVAACVCLAALVIACGGGARREVRVTLDEWTVEASEEQVERGKLRLEVTNDGALMHQLMIVKSDAPPHDLPLAAGNVDESKVNVAFNASPLAAGAAQSLDLDLSPGKYVLICRRTGEATPTGPTPSHYTLGMAVGFIVGQ
jgi:hypothetical protein